jgi:CRISPR/Cas system-associated exonuclease Cas4 (RecB family)
MNIINVLDEFLLSQKKPDRETGHHPSECSAVIDGKVVGRCQRQRYYKWIGEKETNPPDATSLGKMMMGTLIHDWAEKVVTGKLPEAEIEKKIEANLPGLKYPVAGHIDILYDDTVIDIKTSFGRGMTNRESGAKYQGAKPEYILQVLIYMKILGLTKGCIPNIARDSYYRLSFEFTADQYPGWVDKAIERMKELEDFVSRKEIPPRDFDKDKDWQCKYCSYSDHC